MVSNSDSVIKSIEKAIIETNKLDSFMSSINHLDAETIITGAKAFRYMFPNLQGN